MKMKFGDAFGLAARRTIVVWGTVTISAISFVVVSSVLMNVGTSGRVAFLFSLSAIILLGTALVFRLEKTYFDSDPYKAQRSVLPDLWRTQFLSRIYLVLRGAPKLDLCTDVVRLFSFTVISVIIVAHFVSESPALHSQGPIAVISVVALIAILLSSFVYPLLRTQSTWDHEYRYRKVLSAHALNYASSTLLAPDNDAIRRAVKAIEHDALAAVKSYLEYSVLDRTGKNFNVNLIVAHPQDQEVLVCVARTRVDDASKVPTFYRREEMTIASRALSEGKPIYIGDFVSSMDKPYRMVWHIPIATLGSSGVQGLVAIDSRIPNHLDLLDEREAVLFNLLPYLALLRFSLGLRSKNRIWHSILLQEMSQRTSEALPFGDYHVDESLDQMAVGVLAGSPNLDSEYLRLRQLSEDIRSISTARKVFSILFPNVEANNQKVRA